MKGTLAGLVIFTIAGGAIGMSLRAIIISLLLTLMVVLPFLILNWQDKHHD